MYKNNQPVGHKLAIKDLNNEFPYCFILNKFTKHLVYAESSSGVVSQTTITCDMWSQNPVEIYEILVNKSWQVKRISGSLENLTKKRHLPAKEAQNIKNELKKRGLKYNKDSFYIIDVFIRNNGKNKYRLSK